MARLLGMDIGTSGCKAIVIDESGRIRVLESFGCLGTDG